MATKTKKRLTGADWANRLTPTEWANLEESLIWQAHAWE